MKNLKNLLPALALVLGLTFAFTQIAFKSDVKKSTTLKYRYIGNDETGLTTLANWEDVSNEPSPEACESGTEIPCLVVFEDNEYDDINDFITVNNTNAKMLATTRVVSKKDETSK